MTLLVPIVGSHFHPPAKWVLQHLPNGAALRLEAEPENPYDAKAIKVFARPGDVPESERPALEAALDGTGTDMGELMVLDWVCLGHIGDSDGKLCAKHGWRGNREVATAAQALGTTVDQLVCQLTSLASGQPACAVEEA